MLLILLSYLGGALTIVSPCILPVLPFVFARTGQPFRGSGLPLLAGMALTFALVATLAAVGGGWVVRANEYGRWLALGLMAFFALTLLLPGLAERLTGPLVAAGDRLARAASKGGSGAGTSFLLGIATGLLWAPCAGPVLGLLLTGAALNGASAGTTLLLLAYAAGAATSLAVALLVGGKVYLAMKRSLGAGAWLRRGLGAAMLGGVAAIALGWDTGVLSRVSGATTAGLEQRLVNRLAPSVAVAGGAAMTASGAMAASGTTPASDAMVASGAMMAGRDLARGDGAMAAQGAAMMAAVAPASAPLGVEGRLPSLSGAVKWLNSAPLTPATLKGKVVLVDFWTYSCINCLRSLPYVQAWAEKYRDQGLVVIGVHAPEFAFERDLGNVGEAVRKLGITYPVAIDNDYAIWRAMGNQYWPAHYFIDAQGRVRGHHFGEGDYAGSERIIQQLLAEAGHGKGDADVVRPEAEGVQRAAAGDADADSPETYLGYERAQNFASVGGELADASRRYAAPALPALNHWALDGAWTAGRQQVTLTHAPGRIVYRFHARDLHLVLGTGGKPARFRVTIDGAAPGPDHGSDIGADGVGTVSGQRLYQLVRQAGPVRERTFSIEFLDPGVQAYAFTFG